MSDTNETIADIIAEMRGDGHTGPADALEWVRTKLEYYADRLEAAHKREIDGPKKQVCNAAKLREAIDYLCERVADMDATFDPSEVECLRTALAAPPRNCDVMDWRTAWKIWREKFHPETPVGYSAVVKGTEAFMDWFAAPATEQEGGAK